MEIPMCNESQPTPPATAGACTGDDTPAGGPSRRQLLKSGMAVAAATAAAPMLPTGKALAEGAVTGNADADPELARVQGERRILLKGGVVLTLDPRVGDFAHADVLIEDGRIREVRPNIPPQ